MNPDEQNPLRSDFLLDPEIVFLNHGSFGATPRPVFEAYQRWQRELERQPVEFLGRRANALLRESRKCLAGYLNTETDNLVFVTNATTGLNIVARSLRLGPGDEVLASDHEYGALDRTWKFLSRKQGFKYINHPVSLPVTTPDRFVEEFWSAVTSSTRVIFLSHITSPTALIFPVQEICRRARQARILTVIDGAHVPGQLPINLDELGADFYSGNLHKWLCAPKGSAFLYAREEVQSLLEPLVVSWGWESDTPGPSRFVDYQEWTGTRDISAFLAVPEAIRYEQDHDWPAVQRSCHELAAETERMICEISGIAPLHDGDTSWFAQMVAAPVPQKTDLAVLKTRLYDEFRVEVPVIDWNDRKYVRVSIQGYNTRADELALVNALKVLL